MRLFAISDLHLSSPFNRAALAELEAYPEDWIVLAGDIGETAEQLEFALEHLVKRFDTVIWIPGNHDLWTIDPGQYPLRGESKYRRLVDICRAHGVLTPEDPYPLWPGEVGDGASASGGVVLAPMFLLYDYSFRAGNVSEAAAVAWAAESGVYCGDEELLDPAPHPSRQAWCRQRLALTEPRLAAAAGKGYSLVLLNHFPLRADLIDLADLSRFSIWCGSNVTEDWHKKYRAIAVVHGHLHQRGTHYRDEVRFEEVSLGYAQQWNRQLGIGAYFRQILPVPSRR